MDQLKPAFELAFFLCIAHYVYYLPKLSTTVELELSRSGMVCAGLSAEL
jgi:hypothetical protein